MPSYAEYHGLVLPDEDDVRDDIVEYITVPSYAAYYGARLPAPNAVVPARHPNAPIEDTSHPHRIQSLMVRAKRVRIENVTHIHRSENLTVTIS